jgi:Ca2+-transporting ATPase
MKRPPRPLSERLFNPKFILIAIIQGAGMLAASFLTFCYYVNSGAAPDTARAMAFMTLVSSNVMLIVTNLSWSHNFFSILKRGTRALFIIVASVLAAQLLIINIPALASLFRFSRLSFVDISIAIGASFASILWFEALKAINSKRRLKILSE